MFKTLSSILIVFFPALAFAQEEAVTSSGKVVLLYPDSTWKLKPQETEATASADTFAIVADSVVTHPKPEALKHFTETSTGFKGFQKPALKLPDLPEMSDGVYQFRVRVNKQGIVKEVVTLLRGPNGEAEIMMRNAITHLKFLWDNSIVPPLTEGIIKITVPAVK